MKKLLYIFIILLFASCRNRTEKTALKKDILKDTVSKKEPSAINKVAGIKISAPFNINDIKCIWKQIDSTSEATTLELRDYKTQRILLSYSDYFKSENDVEAPDYFKEHFQDLNFDGFKEFLITSQGSSGRTDLVNIYLFNEKTKSFEFSEDLSDNMIEELDSIHKTLLTSSYNIDNEIKKKHYFDKNGTIKYSEIITKSSFNESDSIEKYNNRYEKVINGKVVKTKKYITTE